jgi:hypothetical protein
MSVPILGTSVIAKDSFRQYLISRNPNAPLEVLDLYYELEAVWGVRADVLMAQMVLETEFLKSWWSQPPRRNMAGIGVTGEVSTTDPHSDAWAKGDDGKWYKGYSFGDWRAAVNAHFGHMIAYSTADERNNAPAVDPRFKPARTYFASKGWALPIATVLTDLNGKWAVPGTTYGQTIEQHMNNAASFTPAPVQQPIAAPPVETPAPVETPPPVQAPVQEDNTPLEIVDRSANTPANIYLPNRDTYKVQLLVLHDTVSTGANYDRNDLPLDLGGFQARENETVVGYQGGGAGSVHYLIGPEPLGGRIYQLLPEEAVAVHVAGTANAPSSWVDPFSVTWTGQKDGVDLLNYISIGIVRWGAPDETPGPHQSRALLSLAIDIATRYNLTPQRVVAYRDICSTSSDGSVMLQDVRNVLAQYLPN